MIVLIRLIILITWIINFVKSVFGFFSSGIIFLKRFLCGVPRTSCQLSPCDFESIPITPLKDPLDRKVPNLFVGKVLEDNSLKVEVVFTNDAIIQIKILHIYWGWLKAYVDVDKIYPATKHKLVTPSQGKELWEISTVSLKKTTGRLFLCWEIGWGWNWELV